MNQFVNDNGASIINAGTSEGASKGWMTRRGGAEQSAQSSHADKMSEQADEMDAHHKNVRLESTRDDSFAAHRKAEVAHGKAMKVALRNGDRAGAAKHADAAAFHAQRQDELTDEAREEKYQRSQEPKEKEED